MPIFLDTKVFLYAAGRPHPEREACALILRRVADGSLEATTNTEVIQEILYVLTRRGQRQEALQLAGAITALLPDLRRRSCRPRASTQTLLRVRTIQA